MFRISSNADQVADKYRKRASTLKRGVHRGLRDIAARIDVEQVKNLRGGASASPGSYPVPIRSGNLFQSHYFDAPNERYAVVGNAAIYASVIHRTRPFLEDAVNAVDTVDVMGDRLMKEALAV